jgi:hypothetical protein
LNKYRKTFSMSDVRKRIWPLNFLFSRLFYLHLFFNNVYFLFRSFTENAKLYVLLIIIFARLGTSCNNWEKYQCWDCIILYLNRKTSDRFFC